MIRVLTEAAFVGIVTVIFGYAIMEMLKRCSWFQSDCGCPRTCCCRKSNRLAAGLFLTGALLHIFFEVVGGNKYFCEKSFSCKGGSCVRSIN